MVVAALPAAGLDLLRRRFDVDAGGDRPERSWLYEHIPGAAALVTGPGIEVDGEFLDMAGGSLKVVSNFGRLRQRRRRRDPRASSPSNRADVLTNATAELAISLMLAAGRRIAEADAMIRRGQWSAEDQLLGRELSGATVGLVGYGCIARRVAEC